MLRLIVLLSTVTLTTSRLPLPVPSLNERPMSIEYAVKKLRKAMKGWGTDEQAIIDVLTHQRYNNRIQIASKYEDDYGETLWKAIKGETSGHFKGSLKPLVMTHSEYFAATMYYAMKGPGTEESALINTLMLALMKDHAVLKGTRIYYMDFDDKTLIEKIVEDTSDEETFRDFLISTLQRKDFGGEKLNRTQVELDYYAIKAYVQKAEISSIIGLFNSRSLPHVKAISEYYYQKEGKELVNAIKDITDHHTQEMFISFLAVAVDPVQYLANELNKSMEGWGTDEDLLTRIICTRADVDLEDVKAKYELTTGRQLSKDVKDETSGDYRKVLLSLID